MPLKLPPIHRLPVELLSEIFHWHSLSSNGVVNYNGTFYAFYDVDVVKAGPWLLTHVCRYWREIATTLTSLWSSFIIRSKLLGTKGPDALLQTVLRRSGQSPLSFEMWLSALSSMEMPIPRILALLAAHSTTWKDIELELPSHGYYIEVMGVLSSLPTPLQLPLLEKLRISISETSPEDTSEDTSEDSDSDASEPDQHSIATTFANSPMLHSVIMDPFLPISLPWPQITYLCTSKLSLEQLLDTLRVAIHLETLFLMSDSYADPQENSPIPVTNNAIKTLRLCDTEFLPYLTLPSLIYLRIENDLSEDMVFIHENQVSFVDWDKVPRFVGRSGCVLKWLRISVGEPTDSLFAMLRTAMTDVTDMTVINDAGCVSLCTILPALQKDPLLMPKLEVLYFDGSNSRDLCGLEDILEFVQSRYGNGMGPLKSLHIDCEVLYPEEKEENGLVHFSGEDRRFYLDQLKVFVDEGLDLVIDLDEELIEI
ncbi:uncharacterized protein EV420DRAFT_9039 [Desarmillaria tabescens]|uniref:F-box domain-containing protein n=1 Tax=Armillaria tabescens TaxID=1929756 RepID=A0AA39NP78_ARMTA|nr:uncharacterized protein EV420DRAFT_9039 [Desarmillaria tabescens]KAK0469114.1 hypothetical protein EV420DRAFT_9039 [Desarmillaria tabescens]